MILSLFLLRYNGHRSLQNIILLLITWIDQISGLLKIWIIFQNLSQLKAILLFHVSFWKLFCPPEAALEVWHLFWKYLKSILNTNSPDNLCCFNRCVMKHVKKCKHVKSVLNVFIYCSETTAFHHQQEKSQVFRCQRKFTFQLWRP